MEYTIIVENNSYDLPKKTISVMSALDEVMKVDQNNNLSVRQKFEKLHKFMKDTVGEDNCKEIFGSDHLDDIDLSDLTLTVNKVIDAYEKPVVDYHREKNMNKLNEIPLEKIISITKAANTMASFPKK